MRTGSARRDGSPRPANPGQDAAMQYVVLLRGINVGGNNLIKMTELKACLESRGFRDVTTYIQSGNVLFSAPASKPADLASRIETLLTRTFDYPSSLVLKTLT